MDRHLEKRLDELSGAETIYHMKLNAVSVRFSVLYEAVRMEMELTHEQMHQFMWGEGPKHGGLNRIASGEAEPSPEDSLRLMRMWHDWRFAPKVVSVQP